ncbi:MAG: DUF6463 family protein [Lapillicoccus sp.]
MERQHRRPLVGPLMVLVGATHVAITPLVHPGWVTSIREGGVFGAVERDPAHATRRAAGFWYATCGLSLVAYGLAVAERERQPAPVPASHAGGLAVVGAFGAALLPKSPFWVLLGLSGLSLWRRRSASGG